MKLEFLGTGTSTGVPQIGCRCDTCVSDDPRDKRFRASAILMADDGTDILIDCGPDFRSQILRAGSPPLSALVITHSHYDHVGGVDDLRPYCNGKDFPVFCKKDVANDLRQRNPWSFATNPYPGVPTFAISEVEPYVPFQIGAVAVTPVIVMHARLPIIGFRFDADGRSLGYVTDCKTMPQRSVDILRGVDMLVVNALRYEEHISHMTVPEALALVERIAPRRTFFTHICHRMGRHADIELPDSIELAYDGLVVERV